MGFDGKAILPPSHHGQYLLAGYGQVFRPPLTALSPAADPQHNS